MAKIIEARAFSGAKSMGVFLMGGGMELGTRGFAGRLLGVGGGLRAVFSGEVGDSDGKWGDFLGVADAEVGSARVFPGTARLAKGSRDVAAPQTAVTPAAALATKEAMSDARSLINTRQGEQRTCRDVRDADVDALYKRISNTIAEVGQVLSDTDGRWETLGLNIPATPHVPEPVAAVTLSPAGPGRVLAQWDHARRATRYRVEVKVVGVDADFREVETVADLEYVLKDLPTAATVEVQILAANPAGDAAPCPVASVVVG